MLKNVQDFIKRLGQDFFDFVIQGTLVNDARKRFFQCGAKIEFLSHQFFLDFFMYKDSWESLVGLCDEFLYLGGNEQGTHKYVSELIGKETVETTSRSLSRGRSGSSSTSHQQTARDLMTPDEVRLLSNDKALLFVRGERPVMDWKYNLLRHPNIRFTEDGGAPPYDYTVAPDAHEDLAGNAENYELLDMDDFLPAAEQPKPMFTYPRRNAHASQQD